MGYVLVAAGPSKAELGFVVGGSCPQRFTSCLDCRLFGQVAYLRRYLFLVQMFYPDAAQRATGR